MTMVAVLLAAGESERFGSNNKLLAPFLGKPLILHAARPLIDLEADHLVAVTDSCAVRALLPEFHCIAPDSVSRSQANSFLAGLKAAEDLGADSVLFSLGDMPFISTSLLKKLILRCTTGTASVSSCNGFRSAPACFSSVHFEALTCMTGDSGARMFTNSLPVGCAVKTDPRSMADIDYPEDIEKWETLSQSDRSSRKQGLETAL
ncbi:nucleotidyltransferase family protein [Cognatishimia maritima]|uniref:Molybdenum cofactor cytidylyltransferase n=1 Tax=Cognatishimia maritima TaxID=870908 RepID=A0A1M5LAY7_9RHOB|nr:nucleotidyltransferase family protein [Cognatishimia maritima]SHG62262.1 molybdenum cofactor cytidylyltransferase [Cognatishimia maritima]